MGIRKNGTNWEYRFRWHGQDVRENTGLVATEQNRKIALQLEAVHRVRLAEGKLGIHTLPIVAMGKAIEEFLTHEFVIRRQHRSTWERIKTSMASVEYYFGSKTVGEIHAGHVEKYKVWRLQGDKWYKPVKEVTCKHDLDSLSLFFKWAIRMRYARHNPVADVRKPSDKEAIRIHVITKEEEEKYFSIASENLRDVAKVMLWQGLRPNEVFSLTKENVNFELGYMRIVKGKTKAAKRSLLMTDEVRKILEKRRDNNSVWFFPSDRGLGRNHITRMDGSHDRVMRKTGMKFVLYDFRHTFATRMVHAGVSLATLKDIMGHKDIRVTQRYVHPTQEHQDEAMRLYSKGVKKDGLYE